MSVSSSKNRYVDVGCMRFVVFPDGKYRWFSESLIALWWLDLDPEWRRNLAALKRCKPLFPEDEKYLADAERWLNSKGGDE